MNTRTSDLFQAETSPRRRFLEDPLPDATPEQLEDAAVVLADWRAYPNHLAAARALGVSLATLAAWKLQHPALQAAWDKAAPLRMLVRTRPEMVGIDAKGRKVIAPDRTAWEVAKQLIYGVDVGKRLTENHERQACAEVGLAWEVWQASCQRWPRIMKTVKRQRRELAG